MGCGFLSFLSPDPPQVHVSTHAQIQHCTSHPLLLDSVDIFVTVRFNASPCVEEWSNVDDTARSSLLILLPLSFCTFALTLDGFLFWHDPDTLRPVPDDILFVFMRTQTGDPTRVDVELYNIDRGNKTAGLSTLDPIRDKEVGLEVPWVPPG